MYPSNIHYDVRSAVIGTRKKVGQQKEETYLNRNCKSQK